MEGCGICNEKELYVCTWCNIVFCKAHKIEHTSGDQRFHLCENIEFKLAWTLIYQIVDTLSGKIRHVNKCLKRVINITQIGLSKIQHACSHIRTIIKEKKQQYADILSQTQISFSPGRIQEIQPKLKEI